MSDLIEITPVNQPFWDGLREGFLQCQRCPSCGHAWLPARTECPQCLRSEPNWERVSGNGRVISWVVYRTAYHESVRDMIPYNVAIVELDEGPRVITNILEIDHDRIEAEMPVRLKIVERSGLSHASRRRYARDRRVRDAA